MQGRHVILCIDFLNELVVDLLPDLVLAGLQVDLQRVHVLAEKVQLVQRLPVDHLELQRARIERERILVELRDQGIISFGFRNVFVHFVLEPAQVVVGEDLHKDLSFPDLFQLRQPHLVLLVRQLLILAHFLLLIQNGRLLAHLRQDVVRLPLRGELLL